MFHINMKMFAAMNQAEIDPQQKLNSFEDGPHMSRNQAISAARMSKRQITIEIEDDQENHEAASQALNALKGPSVADK